MYDKKLWKYFVSGVDDAVLSVLATHIGFDWRRVGRHLKPTTAALEHIEMDNPNCTWDRIYGMLQKWCQNQKGSEETKIQNLKKALIDCGYCIEKLQGADVKVNKNSYFIVSLSLDMI